MTAEPDSLRAALTLLSGSGCPVCRAADDAESRFFAWFVVETYGEPPMVEHLRSSLGLCPRHTRRLLREASHPGVPNFVFEQVIAAATARLTAARRPPLATCPACHSRDLAAQRAVELIVAELPRPQVLAAYEETGGLCIPHGLEALGLADAGRGRLLAEALARLFGAGGAPATALAGSDPDASERARLRAQLPPEPGSGVGQRPASDHVGTLRLLRARLRFPACPLCLGLGWAERRYVDWLARGAHDDQSRLDSAAALCPTHLHDLVRTRPSLDEPVGRRAASLWMGALARLQAGLATLGSRTARLLLPRTRSTWRTLRAHVRHALPSCPACSALSVTAERQADLLARALLDRATARRFQSSHGLCIQCVLAGPTLPLALEVSRARLALLRWELEEAARKQAWSFRHEDPGPEGTAWLRAAAVLDGRVFLGGPPARP